MNCDWTEEKRKWAATKTLEQVLDHYLTDLGIPAIYWVRGPRRRRHA